MEQDGICKRVAPCLFLQSDSNSDRLLQGPLVCIGHPSPIQRGSAIGLGYSWEGSSVASVRVVHMHEAPSLDSGT